MNMNMFLRFGTNLKWKHEKLLRFALKIWRFTVGKCFWNNSLNNYGLRSSHYLSTPALSWDAMLNMTTVELELITDHYMYIFFEKGI